MSLGSVYKIHRERYGVSIRKIANATNIAASKLSAFENNKAKLKDEDIIQIYDVIGMIYVANDSHEDEVIRLFILLYKNISYMREGNSRIHDLILDLEDTEKFTDAYITILACSFLYYIYHPNNEFNYEEYCNVILENFDIMDYRVQQIIYDSLGVYYKDIYQWNQALMYINLGIKESTENNTLGMLYYHKTMILKNQYKLSEALSSIKKAKKCFDRELNMKRMSGCSIMLASIYTRLGRFADAEKVSLQCIEARQECDYGNVMIVYNNLVWNYVLSKQYDKVMEYSKRALRISMSSAGSINFYRSFVSWKLGNIREAQSFIIAAQTHVPEESIYMRSMINTFEVFLTPTISVGKKENFLLLTLMEAEKINDLQLQVFVLKILTELDYGDENLVKQVEYRNKIINLLENNH